jgi:hypothetical protein
MTNSAPNQQWPLNPTDHNGDAKSNDPRAPQDILSEAEIMVARSFSSTGNLEARYKVKYRLCGQTGEGVTRLPALRQFQSNANLAGQPAPLSTLERVLKTSRDTLQLSTKYTYTYSDLTWLPPAPPYLVYPAGVVHTVVHRPATHPSPPLPGCPSIPPIIGLPYAALSDRVASLFIFPTHPQFLLVDSHPRLPLGWPVPSSPKGKSRQELSFLLFLFPLHDSVPGIPSMAYPRPATISFGHH